MKTNQMEGITIDTKKVIGVVLGIAALSVGIFKLANKEPQKYSSKWFDSLSIDELNAEREIIRQRYCSAGRDFRLANRMESLLRLFDNVLRERTPYKSSGCGFPVHREHGWYLPNDD